MTSMEEQETTVTHIRGEERVLVYTANVVHLRALRKNPRAVQYAGGDDWGSFWIAAEDFDPLKGFRRVKRELTPEQREAAVERMRLAREAKG